MLCATTSRDLVSCDLDLWHFDIASISYTAPLMPDPPSNLYYPIGYWVINYWIWSHFRYQEQSVRMRRVTWPITGENGQHFWNPWP